MKPNWYPDPLDESQLRWFDGISWTDNTRSSDTSGFIPPPETDGLTTGQKIGNGLYKLKCIIIGGFFTLAGLAYLFSGEPSGWVGLILTAYGVWVLSGLFTGGWRLFIY